MRKEATRNPNGALWRSMVGVIAIGVLLSACRNQHAPQPPTPPTPPAPPAATARASDDFAEVPPAEAESPSIIASAPPWAGSALQSGDPDALKRYLANVHEVVPTKFKVEWSPATVAFNRDAAMRSLRGVSRDGHRFTLDPAEPAVAKLRPGSILWIYDVTVSKVTQVERAGGSVVVHTVPVPLNEAIPNAQISFDARVPTASFMLGRRAPRPPAATAAVRAPRSYFVQVSNPEPPAKADAGKPDAGAGGSPDAAADEDQAADDEDAFQGNTYQTNLKGWDLLLAYVPGPNDGMKIRIEARYGDGEGDSGASQEPAESAELAKKFKALDDEEKKVRQEIRDIRAKMYEAQEGRGDNPVAEGQKHLLDEAKKRKAALDEDKLALKKARAILSDKLWEAVKESFDARFKMQVNMEGFSAAGDFLFNQGDIEQTKFALKALTGHAKVKIITRLGDKGVKGTKIPLMDIPIVFNVPLPIGGIPFMLQIGADFNINVMLAGQHASMALAGDFAFNGNTGFTYSKTSSQYDASFSKDDPTITKVEGLTPGASAFVLGVQLPRIGYGVGLFGMSTMAYFDVVHVLSMTSASSAMIGLTAPCKRMTYAAVGHIGIQTETLPIPIEAVQAYVKDKLNPKHEVFKLEKVAVLPHLKICELDPS